MTASHDPINDAAAGTVSASTTNLFPDLRGLFTVLLVLAAMLSISAGPARADIEAPHAINGHAEAPVEAGIDAAKAGRIRDAIAILTPHADSGHAMANYVLGLIYLRDHGALTSRPTQSHRHFSRAAAAGHVSSIFEAAFQFERGIGTARDMGRAIQLYRIAARANHLNAQFNLAVLLSHQKAERKDLQQAYFWAIAARNNAVRTGAGDRQESRITALLGSIRPRIPHQSAAQASSAAARLTGQPV
jgi:hypothetical protein